MPISAQGLDSTINQTRLGLQCQTLASYLYLTKNFCYFQQKETKSTLSFFEQNFGPKNIFGLKTFLADFFLFQTIFWSPKIFGQKNPFGPKKIFVSAKVKSTPRPAVVTLESILVWDNCHQDNFHMRNNCLCDSCPQILFL